MSLALGMDDIGTRAQHLSDLHDIWSTGLDYMQRGTYRTVTEKEQIKELESAIKLLVYHMTSEYRSTPYALVINQLPDHAEEIPSSRGTELKDISNDGHNS